MAITLKKNLPAIFSENGFEKTMDWLFRDFQGPSRSEQESESLIKKILYKSKYRLLDDRHPVNALLDAMPNRLEAGALALKLRKVAEEGHTALEKDLQTLAIKRTGYFVELSELQLLNMENVNLFGELEGEIHVICSDGYKKVTLNQKTVSSLKSYIGELDHYSQREFTPDETIYVNDDSIIHMKTEPRTENDLKLITRIPGSAYFNVTDPSTAQAVLEYHAEDERLSEVGGRLIDIQKIDHVWITQEDKKRHSVHYVIDGKIEKLSGLEKEKAQQIASRFANQEGMVSVSPTDIVRMKSVSHMWLSDLDAAGQICRLNFVIKGKEYNSALSYNEAKTFVSPSFGRKYDHVQLSRHESIAPDRITMMHYSTCPRENSPPEDRLTIITAGAKYEASVAKSTLQSLLTRLPKRFKNYVAHSSGGILNLGEVSRINYDPKSETLHYRVRSNVWKTTEVSKEQWSRINKKLNTHPSFINVTGSLYLNADKSDILRFNKDSGKIEFIVEGESDHKAWPRMTRRQAKEILSIFQEHGIRKALEALENRY
jgi:hypothetical protein